MAMSIFFLSTLMSVNTFQPGESKKPPESVWEPCLKPGWTPTSATLKLKRITESNHDIIPTFKSSSSPLEKTTTQNKENNDFSTSYDVSSLYTKDKVTSQEYHNPIPTFVSSSTPIAKSNYSFAKDMENVEDILLGSLTMMMMMINFVGNIPALTYFLRKKRKSPDLFYSVISVVDIGISLCAIPVVISLMSHRHAVLFDNSVFCETWFVLFSTLTKVSMFSVMMLNIFRTTAVVYPFYDIHFHDEKIIPATLIYLTGLFVVDAIYLSTEKGKVLYRKPLSFCQLQANLKISSGITYANFYSGLYQVEVLTPLLVAVICFVVTAVSLARSSSNKAPLCMVQRGNEKKFRKITVTIGIFTAVFLICNLPHLVEQIMYIATGFNGKVFKKRIIKNTKVWQKYGHFTTKFLLTQLNSALSPCLYMARMPQFRAWLRRWHRTGTTSSSRRRTLNAEQI